MHKNTLLLSFPRSCRMPCCACAPAGGVLSFSSLARTFPRLLAWLSAGTRPLPQPAGRALCIRQRAPRLRPHALPIPLFLSSIKSNRLHKRCRSPSVCGRPPKGMLRFAARGLARLSGFSKRQSARPAPAGPPCLCFLSFGSLPVNVYIFALFPSFFQTQCRQLNFICVSLK